MPAGTPPCIRGIGEGARQRYVNETLAENCGSRQLQEIDRQIIRERHADLQTAKRAYAEYREKFDDARGGDARDWLRVGSECSDK